MLGDVLACVGLLAYWRHRPWRGLALAAIWWVSPVSWLSSGVLAYLDGLSVPLITMALVAAGLGRAGCSGVLFALGALVKPTGLVTAPAAVVALWQRAAPLPKALLAGTATVALVLLPFLWRGTLTTAVVHVWRLLAQDHLSGGSPNPWWLVGWILALARGRDASDTVPFVPTDWLPVPAGLLGLVLLALAVAIVLRAQLRVEGPGPTLLAAAVILFAYSMLAIGVHENHAHGMHLLLLATGLGSRPLRVFAAATGALYSLNFLCMSGIGRIYAPRVAHLQELSMAVGRLRLGAGFDLTILLAVGNTLLLGWILATLPRHLAAVGDAIPVPRREDS